MSFECKPCYRSGNASKDVRVFAINSDESGYHPRHQRYLAAALSDLEAFHFGEQIAIIDLANRA